MRKYERLERAVRKQLAKGRAARRKLYELRHTIERRKNRKRARAAEKAAARASLLAGYASEGDRLSPPGTPPFKARQREFATASPLHRRSGSVSSVDVSSDDSSDDESRVDEQALSPTAVFHEYFYAAKFKRLVKFIYV